ncbi:MAG: YicC family protein [Bdellovibrionaceae bacterium]|nr:YicC family protein [Bdellovibrio sp.]
MKSMTGFGVFRSQSNELTIEVSLRAVNGRFLETRFHLPRIYFAFESELKKKLSGTALRGTIDIYISRKLKATAVPGHIVINTKLAQEYMKAFKKLSTDLKIKDTIRLDQISKQPEVVQFEEAEAIHANEITLLKKTFDAALKKFDSERMREGQALKKDLQKNLKDLQRHIQKVSKLREEANKILLERFESKVKSRLPKEVAGHAMDPQRISQEIVIQLEKADINEELTRLTEHLKNFDKLVELSVVEGKKLDFYTQELLREVNTIGSKSQVAGITEAVVEAKTLIERVREQVQNIE